ncbi:MAG: efflux RND transporter periplasmic adaptor subunit [Candidatus Riflebacteria bacterium]|nr:efflux RND transporter periplasmic adaptor subunit [Candidatus Riflebacteria bacterium]
MLSLKRFVSALLAVILPVLASFPALGQSSGTTVLQESVAAASEPSLMPSNEELVGEIVAIRKAAIGTKVAGQLASVPLFIGDLASAGQIMATLDTQDLELSLLQTEANLEVAKARLKILETGSRPEEKKQAEEEMRQAKANMDNAQSDLLRVRDLCQSGAVSKSARDAAEARATVNEAQYQSALQKKALVDLGPRLEEKEAIRAQVRQLEAAMKMARLQLEYAYLRAPFNGMVAQRFSDEGTYVTPTTPIYLFIQTDPVYAVVNCSERLIPLLKAGMTAKICLDAFPGLCFPGTLRRVPAMLDSKTRVARAEFMVSNPDMILKPGMFVRAKILFGNVESGADR